MDVMGRLAGQEFVVIPKNIGKISEFHMVFRMTTRRLLLTWTQNLNGPYIKFDTSLQFPFGKTKTLF